MKIRSPLFSEKSAVDRWSSEPSDVVAPAADSCCTVAEDSVLQCLSSHYSIILVAAGLLFFLIHFIVSKRKKSYLDDLHRDYHRVLREKDSNFHATLQLKDQRIAELQQNLADAVQSSSSSSIEKDRSLTSGNSSSLANRLLDEHKLEVSKLVEECKLQIDQLVNENEVRLGALRTLHNGYVEKLEEDQAATIDALETTHQQTIEQLRSEHQSAMDQLLHSLKSIAPAEKEQYAINLGDPSHALNTKIMKITMEELQRELSARCRENVDLNESNARLREELSATSLLVTNGLSFDKIVADGRVAEDRQRRALLDLISLCRTTTNPTAADATGDNVLATQDGRMIIAIRSSDSCGTDIGSHHDEGDGSPSLQEVTSQLENEILSLRAHAQELRQSRRANAALKFQLAAASSPSKRKGSSLALALSELQKQHGLCTKQLQKHRHCLLAMHRKLLSVDTAVSNSSSSSIVQRGRGSDESSWYDAMFEKIDARLDLLIQQLAPSRAPTDDRFRSITYDTHFDASTSSSNSSSSDAVFTDGLHEVSSSSALSVPFLSLSLASLNDELSSCKLQLQTVTDESQLHRELLEQCRDSLSTATRQLADLTADNQQLADSLDKAEIHINELKVSVTSLGRERVELLRDKQQLSMETEKAKAESESLFRTELAALERTLQGRILERDTLITSLRERVHQCEMLLTIAERSLEEKIEATRRGLLDQNMAYLEQYKSDEAKLCQEKDGLRHLLELSEATRLQLLERVESMEFELRELKGGRLVGGDSNNNRRSRSSPHASSSSSSPVTRKEEYLSRIQDLQIRVEQLLDDNVAKDSIIQQLQTQGTSKSSSTGDIIIIDDSKDIIIEEQAEQLSTVRADLEKVISTYQLKEKAYSRKDSLLVELEVVCGILVAALIFSWVYA